MIVTTSLNTTTEATTGKAGGISALLRIVLSVITTIPVLINIFYIIVCFSALKKKFHYLLVLMLCIGDSILSLSLTLFSLTKLVDSIAQNVHLCTFQTFCVIYGLVFTYTMVFLICTERYFVVKNYNFGVQGFFERFKLVIIGGTLALGLLFSLELTLFVPREPTIKECTVPNLFGEELGFFIIFIAGVLTGLMAGIIILCVLTSILIWQYFFKKSTVQPVTSTVEGQIHLHSQEKTAELLERTNGDEINAGDMSKKISVIVEHWRLERNIKLPNNTKVLQYPRKKFKPDAWEKRAFITTIIIAISTIFLTGPFIFSFWLDYLYGARFTSQKVRLVLFVPLVINSMINPFIYVWRIREIKDKIRKIFTCNWNS